MVYVLIGEGPNSIEIPAMLFQTIEQGVTFVSTQLERDPDGFFGERGTNPYWNLDGLHNWNDHATETDERGQPVSVFYNFYYSGCGECYRFYLRPVDFATPMVGWDLD